MGEKRTVEVDGREKFVQTCKEIVPHLEEISRIVSERYGSGAHVSIGDDGYFSFKPYNQGWELINMNGCRPKARYEYTEEIEL